MITTLKHLEAIYDFFEWIRDPEHSDEEHLEEIQLALDYTRITLKDFDDAFEEGIKIGYPVEQQVKILKSIFKKGLT